MRTSSEQSGLSLHDEKFIEKKIKVEWQQYFGRKSKLEHEMFFTSVNGLHFPLNNKLELEYECSYSNRKSN